VAQLGMDEDPSHVWLVKIFKDLKTWKVTFIA
jgi:hypothetical protein